MSIRSGSDPYQRGVTPEVISIYKIGSTPKNMLDRLTCTQSAVMGNGEGIGIGMSLRYALLGSVGRSLSLNDR